MWLLVIDEGSSLMMAMMVGEDGENEWTVSVHHKEYLSAIYPEVVAKGKKIGVAGKRAMEYSACFVAGQGDLA